MKNLLLLLSITLTFYSFSAKVLISASEQDAEIFSNGQKVGTGTATVVVPKNGKTFVEVKKVGFLTESHTFYKQKGMAKPPKTYHFILKEDDSFTSSIVNNHANTDFSVTISDNISEDDVWRTAVSIVTDYFDVLEVSDKETSYLRTAWQAQSFTAKTVRTRVVLKSGGPGVIKIKLISEYSDKSGTSIRSDEEFKEWDRVLRRYNSLISDFQTRLSH